MPKSNLDLDVKDLARVREVEVSDMKRGFYATCADESICYVTCWKDRASDDSVLCHKHSGDECEGAFRVKLVLIDEAYRERLHQGLLTLTGYEIRKDGRTSGAIISRDHLQLMKHG